VKPKRLACWILFATMGLYVIGISNQHHCFSEEKNINKVQPIYEPESWLTKVPWNNVKQKDIYSCNFSQVYEPHKSVTYRSRCSLISQTNNYYLFTKKKNERGDNIYYIEGAVDINLLNFLEMYKCQVKKHLPGNTNSNKYKARNFRIKAKDNSAVISFDLRYEKHVNTLVFGWEMLFHKTINCSTYFRPIVGTNKIAIRANTIKNGSRGLSKYFDVIPLGDLLGAPVAIVDQIINEIAEDLVKIKPIEFNLDTDEIQSTGKLTDFELKIKDAKFVKGVKKIVFL